VKATNATGGGGGKKGLLKATQPASAGETLMAEVERLAQA
jgi:hypothetical protein